jgi:hypothetical protein
MLSVVIVSVILLRLNMLIVVLSVIILYVAMLSFDIQILSVSVHFSRIRMFCVSVSLKWFCCVM